MVQQQEWSSYLAALESYLAQAARALRAGQLAPVPARLASRAASPPPPELGARVAQLFAQTERLAQRTAVRREEVRNREAVEHIIELVELEPYRHAPVAGLPFGIQKLVGFARALALDPLLLMLDEPSLGLAPLVVKEIFRIIERLRESGATILLIEQNARAAMAVADQAYVLETGAIALSGQAAQLAADPRVIETYLGKARA